MSFDGHEWEEIAVDLGRASARVTRTAGQILNKTLADGAQQAQAFAPVDTGFLRNSIGWEARGLEGEFGATADYAPYVEGGTSRMAPRAFVGPAFDRVQPGFMTAIQALTEEVL